MDERRRFVRLDARLDVVHAVLPSGTMQPTLSKDVSGGGLRLFTDRPLASGTQLQMAIKLPGRETPVNAIGEVVWSEEAHTTGKSERQRSVEIGVRTVEIAPQDHEALTEHVIASLRPP